jgi:hypothetical protein
MLKRKKNLGTPKECCKSGVGCGAAKVVLPTLFLMAKEETL